ncbi:DinB family protein [Xanthomarina sp. F2636L]|uniref:DinB family protein n=1 Tax=Xanthomarina sp. F2636L TaxID=2996018 RepID=UPI00225E01A4|nr:DinB family protein [Xanthomarina sp. F2636L]MCX7551148.1 DinB family protein [Xanthomarina sp. F2636L]
MEWAFDITLKNRVIFKNFLETFSLEQLNKVPKGFSNNIIWNVAHTIVTQQLLVYNMSGLPMLLSDDLVEMYRKGTKVERDVTQAEVDIIKDLLFSTIEKTKEDYNNKLFKDYKEYTVTTKSVLTNVEKAIDFNNFHEGIHLGYILALKKSL